ncbi:hypothetical protein ACE1CD_30510 [Aerosakkonema sp. BLCC-F183]|uniref:hypothetical protein n=1 Tax=Aerosakkonema sp. BLCC-F183 TaxID=3342834 RepID=UPI0035B96652
MEEGKFGCDWGKKWGVCDRAIDINCLLYSRIRSIAAFVTFDLVVPKVTNLKID